MSYGPGLTIECHQYTRNVAKLKFQIQHVSVKSCNISVLYALRVTLASHWPLTSYSKLKRVIHNIQVWNSLFIGSCLGACALLVPNMQITTIFQAYYTLPYMTVGGVTVPIVVQYQLSPKYNLSKRAITRSDFCACAML